MADPLLVLDTGDAWVGGGILGDKTQGKVIVDGMNVMGYDAMALGPMDLSVGKQQVEQRLAEAEFPILSANAVLTGSTDLVTEPYTVLSVGDHLVGIIGLTRVPSEPQAGYDVLNPQEALTKVLPEILDQADTVILLTNLRYRQAVNLVDAVKGVDLLIAGLPDQVPSKVGLTTSGTLTVAAETPMKKHSGRRVGRLLLTITNDGSLTPEAWESRAMDRTLADDPFMKTLLEAYHQ
jgi:2',3'-cyclic-nucleotide 2'-phosphodiesterase (5'-nucleotidase family)